MLEYIYICRHGFRSNWVDPSIKTGPTGMNRDPPLAVHGLEQAKHLADFLASHDSTQPYPRPEIIFSSPFYRCIQTALSSAEALGLILEEPQDGKKSKKGIHLEHGLGEWYSPVRSGTGLHPRPAQPIKLIPLFPSGSINPSYTSTVYPSRKGETLKSLHERAEIFVDAFISRVEGEWPEVKCVVIFSHAASLIAIGRALTGNRDLEVLAGCATTSLYKRKLLGSKFQFDYPSPPSSALLDSLPPCGTGQWAMVYSGRHDYLPSGFERDWSFADAVLDPNGEVIADNGDGDGHCEEEWEEGLAKGMEVWLRSVRQTGEEKIGVDGRDYPRESRI
ncbi:hypothetical protein L204_104495 [Cryptococcus depauperatus]|nr:transcription factor C subunit 7 [Cryptococcus depauperatus CBS 7855]